jgi:hypothetical protein
MGDITVFPTIRNVLWAGNNIHQFIATTAVTAGMVVAFAATGVSGAVKPAVKGTTGQPIGVALYSAAAGAHVAVACNGCICYVSNADGASTIDAGDVVEDNDALNGGTVSTWVVQGGGTATGLLKYTVGIAIDDIVNTTPGRILVKCGVMTAPMTA